MPLYEYSYILAIGTFFAILDAYNNGASESIGQVPHAHPQTM